MQRLRHHAFHLRPHFGVAQPRLGLPLKLRLGELYADDRRQALAHILAREVGVGLLDEVLLAPVVVDDARQRAAKAGDMRAAVNRVDAVCEGVDEFGEAVVVLHRHLNDCVVHLLFNIDGIFVDDRALAVEAADEAGYAAVEVVGRRVVGP